MSSEICGLCDIEYHTKNYGWIWVRGVGHHKWRAPTKEQIRDRLRRRYGLS